MNPHNLHGKGIWIWKISQCENGNLDAIVARARAASFSHVILKICDGDDDYQITNGRDEAAALIPRLTAAGLTVWGWNYIYGDPPARDAGQARYWEAEARRNVQRLNQLRPLGLRGLVIDAEREYETIVDRHTKAASFMRLLRAGAPDLPLALAAWKFPGQHRGFAWSAFREWIDVDMPQVYWIKAHNPAEQLARSQKEFAALTPRLPFAPVGPGFFEQDWRPTPADISAFFAQSVALGLPAASLWAWDHLGLRGGEAHNRANLNFSAEWQAAAAFQWPGQPPAPAPVKPAEPPAPPKLPPSAEIVARYFEALNTRDPDQVAALYSPTAGHVSGQGAIIGQPAIRAYYAGLFARLPEGVFSIGPLVQQDGLRTFQWSAAGAASAIGDGNDLLGVLNGRIQYHYTVYSFTTR